MKKNYILGVVLLIPFITSCLLIFPSVTVSAEPEQADPIKIGMFLPVTAGYNFYGEWARQGFELGLIYATDNTNQTSAGRPYELHYYDTLGSSADIAGIVSDAIETDGIDIIFGGVSSAVAANMIPVAKQYEKLYFVGPAADTEITGALFDKHIFRVSRNNYHDAVAGIYHSMEVLGAKNIAFLAMDYSFGYSGVGAMSQEIAKRGGKVVDIQYAPFSVAPPAGHFTPYLLNLIQTAQTTGIDMLHIIWAGSFTELWNDLVAQDVFSYMNVSGVAIDIASMNSLEASLTPPATIVGGQGLCLYGYKLPDNPVNDWMVQAHIDRNVMPNFKYFGATYRVPELFTASAFGSAQFIVNVTSTVPNLAIDTMIAHLEGLNITCPKGPTYLRPNDHQGLAEMYIADIVNDSDSNSETHNLVIAELNQSIPALACAPPITTDYVPYPENYTVSVFNTNTVYNTDTVTSISVERTPGFSLIITLIGIPVLILSYKRRKK